MFNFNYKTWLPPAPWSGPPLPRFLGITWSWSKPAPPPVQQFTLTVTAGPGGTVSAGGRYPAGSSVNVVATPSSGYILDYWLVNGVKSTTASVTVKMDSDVAATAYFRPQYSSMTVTMKNVVFSHTTDAYFNHPHVKFTVYNPDTGTMTSRSIKWKGQWSAYWAGTGQDELALTPVFDLAPGQSKDYDLDIAAAYPIGASVRMWLEETGHQENATAAYSF